ncbi:hypothetical protein [Convivina praedatoris]|uniref:hypothetical protein n=1 Tax=Convivina praedatoris TaxID=2880963 RepID=UPI00200BE866|nr:hypothetical protein [Convivina sp. LMG 32447]CAH1850843.1 hypothetical protein R078138_00214 [Convivina sp. LMG 32447]
MILKKTQNSFLLLSAFSLFVLLMVASFLYPENNGTRLTAPFFSRFFRVGATLTVILGLLSFKQLTDRTKKILFYILLLLLIGGQLCFILAFQRPLHTDTAYVITMSERLANGNFDWFHYFTIYPNNVNITIFWAFIFKILNFVGLSNHEIVYPWLQLIILDFSLIFFANATNKLKAGLGKYVVTLSFAYAPLVMYVIFPYNDIFAVSLLIIGISCFILANLTSNFMQQIIYYIVTFGSLSLGVAIRQNLVIILIALVLTISLSKRYLPLQKLILIVSLIATCAVFILGFRIAASHSDFHPNVNQETPTMRYVNMSWNPGTSGEIDVNDAWHWSELPKAERSKALSHELKHRLKELGPIGIVKHMVKKIAYMFSIGLPYQDMEDVQFTSIVKMPQWKVKKFYAVLTNLFQPLYIVMLLFSCYTVFNNFKNNKHGLYSDVVFFAAVSVLGTVMFHALLWEVRDRYALPIFPFVILLSAMGIASLKKDGLAIPNFISKITLLHTASALAVVLIVINGVSQFNQFSKSVRQDGLVYSSGFLPYAEPTEKRQLIEPNQQYQTDSFVLSDKVNSVFFGQIATKEMTDLVFTLVNSKTGVQTILPVKNGGVDLPQAIPSGKYYVNLITGNSPVESTFLLEQSGISSLQGPQVLKDGRRIPGMRLIFDLKNSLRVSIIPMKLYILLHVVVLLIILFLWHRLYVIYQIKNN